MIDRNRALAAQIGLRVGHEKSGGDSFAGNVADDEAQLLAGTVFPEVEKVEIVSSDLAGRKAYAGVFERPGLGMDLREQAGLDLLGDFQFLGGAAFGFKFLGEGAAMSFDAAREFVEADQSEGVSIGIFKAGMNSAPSGSLGWELEVDAPFAPLFVLAREVFGNEVDVGWAADEFLRLASGQRQRNA